MNTTRRHFIGSALLSLALFLPLSSCLSPAVAAEDKPIRVLLVTGGHDFEGPQFSEMFRSFENIRVKAVEHPKAHAYFKPEAAKDYDVLVFYDMYQDISEEAKKDLLALLKEGKGLLAMHHCLASYQKWPEYEKIIGGRYNLQKRIVDGVEQPASTYKHDVKFKVKVASPDHPVTQGVKDFEIHDETYGRFVVSPEVKPLLTTDEPTSSPTICWAQTYGNARVVTLQLGHDHLAYENPNFRRIVSQAIQWVAPRNSK